MQAVFLRAQVQEAAGSISGVRHAGRGGAGGRVGGEGVEGVGQKPAVPPDGGGRGGAGWLPLTMCKHTLRDAAAITLQRPA